MTDNANSGEGGAMPDAIDIIDRLTKLGDKLTVVNLAGEAALRGFDRNIWNGIGLVMNEAIDEVADLEEAVGALRRKGTDDVRDPSIGDTTQPDPIFAMIAGHRDVLAAINAGPNGADGTVDAAMTAFSAIEDRLTDMLPSTLAGVSALASYAAEALDEDVHGSLLANIAIALDRIAGKGGNSNVAA